jgi:Condensation domain/Phosphopantetheine attachment site/AMP-binding enzyme C-terminal domain
MRHELAWWERQLAGIPQLCTFPTDRTSDIGASETGSTRPFCWNVELVAELPKLIRREGVTIYMALLAVFAAVLRAHTGQGDIVVGSPMGTRERPEFETIIGPFVNLLVLRLELDDDPSLIELLWRARDVVLDAYDHREVPFDMLVDRLAPPRSFDRPPLCQAAVVPHNASDENAPLIDGGGSVLDLTFVVAQNLTAEQPRLIAYIVYRSGRDLTATEARRHIKRTLPDYMAPSAFVALDALPLTPNGKIDVRALPDPFRSSAVAGDGYEPPAPGLEQLIAEVWRELLQVNRVGADDNFFELRGNSLLSLRAITAIEARAGCRLQPRLLFFQNLRQLAATARLAGTKPVHQS